MFNQFERDVGALLAIRLARASRRQRIDKLISALQAPLLVDARDREDAHIRADSLLLGFINDARVTAAFEAIEKWYA